MLLDYLLDCFLDIMIKEWRSYLVRVGLLDKLVM